MFKKGVKVVLIQLLGIVMGVVSLFYIAGEMSPEVYSLIGIYALINGVVTTFSHLGLETRMMREALMWVSVGNMEKVKEYVTQSFVSRMIGMVILTPFVLVFLYYINETKYDGEHTLILLTFYLGALLSAFIDSMSLIVRSQGGYVFSTFVRTMNTDIVKILGILLFWACGASAYLYFYALSSLPLFLIFLWKVYSCISLRYLKLCPTKEKIIRNKYLWLCTDVGYFKTNADSLLVSVVFPPAIMGSYTIYKTLENMCRNTIAGFFDVLTQETVKYKGDYGNLVLVERKIKKARNLFLLLCIIGVVIFAFSSDWIIVLLKLNRYEYITEIFYCVFAVSAIALIGKYEINMIAFYADSKTTFKLSVIQMIITIAAFLFVVVIPSLYGVFIQRLFAYAAFSLISIVYFKRRRNMLYTKVLD